MDALYFWCLTNPELGWEDSYRHPYVIWARHVQLCCFDLSSALNSMSAGRERNPFHFCGMWGGHRSPWKSPKLVHVTTILARQPPTPPSLSAMILRLEGVGGKAESSRWFRPKVAGVGPVSSLLPAGCERRKRKVGFSESLHPRSTVGGGVPALNTRPLIFSLGETH